MIDDLYNKTVDTIKRIQGKKKYISTQSDECDSMYFYLYDESIGNNIFVEGEIRGLRVLDGEIQLIGTTRDEYIDKFDEDDFERACENYDKEEHVYDCEMCWQNLRFGDILFAQTLFYIAEVIEEYEN